MSFDKEEWLRRYLDDELTGEEERLALIAIADEAELRSLLKFDLKLRQELAADRPTGALDRCPRPDSATAGHVSSQNIMPEGIADSVMQAIDRHGKGSSTASTREEKPVRALVRTMCARLASSSGSPGR
jgi:hypothetical protein